MKACVLAMKQWGTSKDMLELNGTNMKILGKSQNQANTSETTLAIPFPGKFYCLPQLIITSEKSWKRQ